MMPDVAGSSRAATVDRDAGAMLCPACGYDLRASPDRCSECGLVIDRALLDATAIPWAYRRSIGRMRAYLKTVWLFTFDSPRIRHELIRPQDDRDARWFRYANGGVLTIALLIAVGAMALWTQHLRDLLVAEQSGLNTILAGVSRMPGFEQDLLVPWSAGVAPYYIVPLYLAGLSLYVCGIGRKCHRRGDRSPEVLRCARAVSTYAMAPLFWLLPAAIGYAAVLWIDELKNGDPSTDVFELPRLVAVIFTVLLTGFALVSAVRRSGEWVTRASHAGVGRFVLGVVELLGRFALGVVLFLGVLPWCVGYWWIAIDSQF